ncbi:hypothetical protein ACIBO4_16665 [Streptomyces sp. NPDC050149]|uniref:hypothetical protein n=1 Tax=Streptomyces sp. NPDC050149 TaxID=3365603 RepID=UPI00379582AD
MSNASGPIATVAEAVRELGTASDVYGPTLNTTVSLSAVELVGTALCEALRPYCPTTLAFWNSSDDSVLGHVVARELGASVVRADELAGIAALSNEIAAGARVALLATAWTNEKYLKALTAIVRKRSAEVVAVASVFESAGLRDRGVPAVCLLDADRRDAEGPATTSEAEA